MYRIGIMERDGVYLERFTGFLKEHHGDSFEIEVIAPDGDAFEQALADAGQYDALFLGDDVVMEDGFPAEITVGYLTEADETDDRYISKYQSMEQIYRRMLKLCEAGNPENPPEPPETDDTEQEPAVEEMAVEHYDLQAETVTVDGETYRVYHVEEEQVDRLAVRMLTGNRIRGLLQTSYQDGELKMRITGMVSLYEYVAAHNSPKGKEFLLKFFADLFTTALSLEEYMLSADRLMLNPREFYVNEAEERVLLPYLPVKYSAVKDSKWCLEEIRGLCNVLLDGITQGASGEMVILKTTDVYASVDTNTDGETEEFDSLQKNARESLKLRDSTKTLGKEEPVPYIIRKRTGEKTAINRSLFKLGKDASYVDYCIRDNPTVSRNHADIVKRQDGFYLVDKGSLNHTFVNGKKLAADEYRKLKSGCLIQLADEVFEFWLK